MSKRYKIAIAGVVETFDCGTKTLDLAKRLGKFVAQKNHFLVTGSYHGFPQFAAQGAKEAGGEVVYFSPASNFHEHKQVYRLDTANSELIIYTGFGHVGSSLFLTKSCDAVIIGCGKIDALHEFTLAIQEGKPVGVLKGDWETDDIIKKFIGGSERTHMPVVFEEDPEKLIEKVIEMIK